MVDFDAIRFDEGTLIFGFARPPILLTAVFLATDIRPLTACLSAQ